MHGYSRSFNPYKRALRVVYPIKYKISSLSKKSKKIKVKTYNKCFSCPSYRLRGIYFWCDKFNKMLNGLKRPIKLLDCI